MDLHKPKPIHNWRDFLKEVGTIVLGVCIALAAEQAVEWVHWRDKTGYATEQIQLELRGIMLWSAERVVVEDCIQSRLEEMEQKLLATGENWIPMTPVGSPRGNIVAVPLRPWFDTAWRAAVADNSVTHFNREKLARYSGVYGLLERARDQNQKEIDNVGRLNVLLRRVPLTKDRKTELVEVIEQERILNHTMAVRATLWRDIWKDIGLDRAQFQEWVTKNSSTYAACHAAPH